MELLCKVFFNHSDESLPEEIKKFTENEFMKARDQAIQLLNPHYDEWNAAYTKEIKGEDDMEYNAYIQSKQNAILDDFNKMWFSPVKLYSDEYADIA